MTESSTERAAGRPIAFDDVRVGDTIEQRWTSKGVAYSKLGTVAKIDGAYLDAAEGGVVASQYKSKKLLLIDRPKPELPTAVGSVIVNATIRGVSGQVATLVETYEDQFWRTSIKLAGVYTHDLEHITEWTLGKVVPA